MAFPEVPSWVNRVLQRLAGTCRLSKQKDVLQGTEHLLLAPYRHLNFVCEMENVVRSLDTFRTRNNPQKLHYSHQVPLDLVVKGLLKQVTETKKTNFNL